MLCKFLNLYFHDSNFVLGSLAQLYHKDKMPSDLKAVHEANDLAVEAAYGKHFRGDTQKMYLYLLERYAALTIK